MLRSDILDFTTSQVTSSLTLGASYDTRDKIVNATRGQDHRFSVEYAGLGGDIGYTKFLGEMSWYIPIFKWLVGFIHGEVGHIIKNEDKLLPDYTRFYLGGINSVRGFDWRELHLRDGGWCDGRRYAEGPGKRRVADPRFEIRGPSGHPLFRYGAGF